MRVYDFEFNGINLSDFDMILCNFGDKGLDTVSNGSIATFNTVPSLGGSKHNLISTEYEDCLETTVQICKTPCGGNNMEISSATFRELTKWLCRKQFLKFKFLSEAYIDIYYEVKIDVSRIELDNKLVGLELNIVSNRPFALKEPKTIIINNKEENGKHSINDSSYEEGYIYPYTEITIGDIEGLADLRIYNAIEDRETYIANCIANEVIIMDYPIIKSTVPSDAPSHNIQDDFNWNFFRVANTFRNSRNDLTISIPCVIKIKYSPIVKVGL